MYTNLGLVGYPLSHSFSPLIQTSFLHNSGINGGYTCFEEKNADKLPELFAFLRSKNFRGVNVTVPHKVAVHDLMDSLDPLAEEAGAVNTVLFEDGSLKGFNTDVYGFDKTLELEDVAVDGADVLMLGCGGAATAVLLSLKKKRGVNLTVLNRDLEKAHKVLKSLNFDNAEISDYNYMRNKREFDVIINATSLGLDGGSFLDMTNIGCRSAAVDLQYKPWVTPFLKTYEGRGCKLVNGFPMLVHQAHRAFYIWTGVNAPIHLADLKTKTGADI
ncbi:shikimate dehydrogenase [Limisalsivibrio acetivorans]|uniref:shikimate dehydrogenase n=1 Tax=Limisalsivibrio acetivorans TaxID=1304888 RepID=UPI0003FF8A3F|nr:shikimate dehydrogenase [Limisalsivibrio acetivorans]